jgi:hypothetical protein
VKQITTIGLDLAKQIFQVHGADADGFPVFNRRLRRAGVLRFFEKAAFVSGRYRSLREFVLLGARDCSAWSRCAIDSTSLCEAFREAR